MPHELSQVRIQLKTGLTHLNCVIHIIQNAKEKVKTGTKLILKQHKL